MHLTQRPEKTDKLKQIAKINPAVFGES